MAEGTAGNVRSETPKTIAYDGIAGREKTWDECGIEEKVERLRHALLRSEHLIQGAGTAAHEALRKANQHQHAPTGQVLVPAAPDYNYPQSDAQTVRALFHGLR